MLNVDDLGHDTKSISAFLIKSALDHVSLEWSSDCQTKVKINKLRSSNSSIT